jgi:hypothetical protein
VREDDPWNQLQDIVRNTKTQMVRDNYTNDAWYCCGECKADGEPITLYGNLTVIE